MNVSGVYNVIENKSNPVNLYQKLNLEEFRWQQKQALDNANAKIELLPKQTTAQ